MSTPSNIPLVFSPSDETTPNKEQKTPTFDQSVSHMELGNKLQQSMKSNVDKELHQIRIQTLRKELDYLKTTDWEFETEKVLNYFFPKKCDGDGDHDLEEFLAEQLLDLEVKAKNESDDIAEVTEAPIIPRSAACFQRTGSDLSVLTSVLLPIECLIWMDVNKYLNMNNEENNIKFCGLVEQHRVLYDHTMSDYHNRNVSDRAWAKIAQILKTTGRITFMAENYVLIDGMLYFDLSSSSCSINLNVNDNVLYLGYEDSNASITVVRILENYGTFWGDEENIEENSFKIIEHVIIGEVDYRQERHVFMKNSDLKFNLDDVEAVFIPIRGDWLELKCSVQFDEDKPSEINSAQVLQVISFKALRSKIEKATVTDWSGENGVCDRQIYFDKQSLQNGINGKPFVGAKVLIEAIESNQGTCTWRAIKMISMETKTVQQPEPEKTNEDELSLKIEKEKNIDFTYPVKFDKVDFQETRQMTISITNNGSQIQIINKWIMLSKRRDSQVEIKPFLQQPKKLYPKETFRLTVKCYPKFLGNTKECIIVMFRGFQLKRFIEMNVVNSKIDENTIGTTNGLKSEHDKVSLMKNVRKNSGNTVIPGVKLVKAPAFIPVKLGSFTIPDKIWSAVLGDSEQTLYSSEFDRILDRIEQNLPYLTQDLSIHNYTDRWHALVYMEEIQSNINIRVYDTPKAFLIRCQEYLALEFIGLAERRPSLITGDRVIVKDTFDANSAQYEGYIHAIRGNLVMMKFSPTFHEMYTGSDVSVEFHITRSTFRRTHQAINLAIFNLGPEVLFPSRLNVRPPLVKQDKVDGISWFNAKLNDCQKAAVINILKAEARPLPYCIFGPPGTGKTVTVIEVILQILQNLPDSRILVATPSNSAANLITERLIEQKNASSNSIIRLIANYLLDGDTIPDVIRPFCGTLDIAREDTWKPRHYVKDGVQMNCQTSFIGRHRVTIGTCVNLGTLAQMGLPRGHFTHIIVDEAGQATEPEIMIPMTFIDKDRGQIVLAGDPKQLGPVVMSKYCLEFGMDETYLSRILETFPYQRDFESFSDGFNPRLVTKLNDNYRSLEEVLSLPSEMFYDGSLVAKVDRNTPWVTEVGSVISEMFDRPDSKGGIYVYGIRGCNSRAQDSPSWFNPQEASMVALTTCKLYKKKVNIDDIGIITPYVAQVKYLRLLFDAMGLPQPKIGSVEEFQGQERPIILISTVRSTESLLYEDHKHSLGFVKSPKRLNVALTRAQVAVILFCNPHLLCLDPLWKRVISQSVKDDKFMGCDLPYDLSCKNKNVDE